MKIYFWVLCFALAACTHNDSKSVPAMQATAESGGPSSAACQAFIKSLPANYMYGFVQSPEVPTDPTSNPLTIFYYGNLLANVTPVAVFNGGPTSNSWGTYRVLTGFQAAHPELANVSFVFIDQRGTGCSTPFPHTTTTADLERLRAWGSAGIVADAEIVRKTLLADKPWKILGQSYGGLIVHRYVQIAPKSVVSVSSHGFALTNDPFLTKEERVESQQKVVEAYLAQYPGDRDILAMVNQKLASVPCFTNTTGDHKFCGHTVLGPLYSALGFQDQWAWMHSWIADWGPNKGITQKWVNQVLSSPSRLPTVDSIWANDVIWREDMNFSFQNKDVCAQIYKDLAAKGENPQGFLLNECQPALEGSGNYSSLYRYILAMPTSVILPTDFKPVLTANPQLKFFLYSGELDPYSPVAIFKDELAALGNLIQYFDFSSSGHNGFFSELRVWQDFIGVP